MSYFVQYVYFVTKCFHIIIHFCKHFRTIFNSSSYWGCYSSYGLSHSAQQTWTLLLVRGEFLKPECTVFICTYIFKLFRNNNMWFKAFCLFLNKNCIHLNGKKDKSDVFLEAKSYSKIFWTDIKILCIVLLQRMTKGGRKPLPFCSVQWVDYFAI